MMNIKRTEVQILRRQVLESVTILHPRFKRTRAVGSQLFTATVDKLHQGWVKVVHDKPLSPT